jgi:hypothetical protein
VAVLVAVTKKAYRASCMMDSGFRPDAFRFLFGFRVSGGQSLLVEAGRGGDDMQGECCSSGVALLGYAASVPTGLLLLDDKKMINCAR